MTAPTQTAEVERIARGLTAAEAMALLNHCEAGYFVWRLPAENELSFGRSGAVLVRKKLISFHPAPHLSSTCLTPLGLAVRRHLQEQGR